MRAVCLASDLLNEDDLRTSIPHRWRKAQLMASTTLVPPSPLGQRRCRQRGTPPYASHQSVKYQQWRR